MTAMRTGTASASPLAARALALGLVAAMAAGCTGLERAAKPGPDSGSSALTSAANLPNVAGIFMGACVEDGGNVAARLARLERVGARPLEPTLSRRVLAGQPGQAFLLPATSLLVTAYDSGLCRLTLYTEEGATIEPALLARARAAGYRLVDGPIELPSNEAGRSMRAFVVARGDAPRLVTWSDGPAPDMLGARQVHLVSGEPRRAGDSARSGAARADDGGSGPAKDSFGPVKD